MTRFREAIIQLTPRFLLRIFAGPYIAGNSIQSALTKADQLWSEYGLSTTLDLLGEGVTSHKDAEDERDEYLRMIQAIGTRSYVTISLKPTQLGLAFDASFCRENILRILEQTEPAQIQVTIDMEESDYTDATLKMFRELRQDYTYVGTVLQSRLFRTSEDIEKYLQGFKAHIRLCLGIYNEPKEIAYQSKREMKENFIRLAEQLWKKDHFVALATHDEKLLRTCIQRAQELDVPQGQYEAQMLLGVPRENIQQEVLSTGLPMRLYVPYGTTWEHAYAYAKRRLIENPNIGVYVLGNVLRRAWSRLLSIFKRDR